MDWSPPDCDRLTDDIRRTAQQARSRNVTWRPHVTGKTPADISSQCLIHGAAGLSVSTISDAAPLATLGAASILVSLPPAFSEIKTVGSVRQATNLLLTIDHFVQAEEIAKHRSDHWKEQPVVILLQGDQPGPGIRPGLDALRLAQGVSRLAGLQVIGLSVLLTNNCDAHGAIKSAAHTQAMLRHSAIDCDVISLSGSADLLPTDSAVVTEIRDPHLNFTSPMTLPAGDMTAEVISRPSLEIAILSAAILSASHAFRAAIGRIRLPDFPAAKLSPGPDNCCVVTTNGDAQRLKIGDKVRIERN